MKANSIRKQTVRKGAVRRMVSMKLAPDLWRRTQKAAADQHTTAAFYVAALLAREVNHAA